MTLTRGIALSGGTDDTTCRTRDLTRCNLSILQEKKLKKPHMNTWFIVNRVSNFLSERDLV